MDTLQTIFARRSVRKYKDTPIPNEHLTQILEAARQAPSAGNRQSWHFVVLRNAEQRRRVAEACNSQMWMADADCIIVAVGLPQVSPRWYRVDAAIALQNLVLAARSLGYGTCWIGAFDPTELKRVCGIPDDAEIVACTPLGVPDVEPPARPRKEWSDLFSGERHGTPMEP
jgi:nitroreductase